MMPTQLEKPNASHDRVVHLLRALTPDDCRHGRHHTAHILELRHRTGW